MVMEKKGKRDVPQGASRFFRYGKLIVIVF